MRETKRRCVSGLILVLASLTAQARIVRIAVTSDLQGATAGVPETYHVIKGLAYGEINPDEPRNSIIQDIALAPRNSGGNVEYIATFTLYAPVHPSPKAALIYAVVNRGGDPLPREYANGDFYLLSGWQGDILFGGTSGSGDKAETIKVPIARNTDGSSITGPAFARFIDLPSGTRSLSLARSLTYSGNDLPPTPFDLDTSHAHLYTNKYEDIDGSKAGVVEISSSDWSWGNCDSVPFPGTPDPARICLRQDADPTLMYELHYTAKDPLVLGLGFATVRDLNDFFLTSATDSHGFRNPVVDHVRAAMALGFSQSGNFLRSFINLGFNQGEDGRRVFAGVMVYVSARQVPLNVRFGVPGGTSMLYELGTDGVNWWAPAPDIRRHNAISSLLERCTASTTCPNIIDLLGSAEFYSLRASMGYVGTSAVADIPLPPNVRRYYFAGTTHGGGSGGFSLSGSSLGNCMLTANPNPEEPTLRALILALKQWITDDTIPPESVYPTLRANTLAPAAQVLTSFPRIPRQPLPHDVLNPHLVYEPGPTFRANDVSGIPADEPPAIIGATPSVLPTLDADGNEVGGIHSPLQEAPLGTYVGWNVIVSGFRKGQFCPLAGGYIPFVKTEAERKAAGDPRPSIEERYSCHEDYVNRVRSAAQQMVSKRLMLQDDAAKMIQQAEDSSIRK
jgi:hypothetical protein